MDLKKAKWLIPVLALLVIFESVLIVQRLSRKRKEVITEEQLPSEVMPKERAVINFKGDSQASMETEGTIEVVMAPLETFSLDGMDVLIEYDPDYLEILGTDPSDKFSYLARNWVEPDKKRILVSLLETEFPEGVAFQAGQEINLVTISYLPKRSGKTSLRIIGDAGEKGTVLAENGTAKEIPFSTADFDLTIR